LYANIIGATKKNKPVSRAVAVTKKVVVGALKEIADILQKAQAFGDSTHDYLEFLYTLTRDEKSMFEKIKREYRSDQPMRFFVHYMMDMKYGCEEPDDPYYAFFPQQCEYMLQLAACSGGSLIGFSAFDPRRENWREIADKSLRMGFLGFKFYPSMGFLPIGNEANIERRVEDFFLYCIEREIPVVAHCTPTGFQGIKGSGVKAHPKHWLARLETKGFENLRLNLGHAGGGEQHNAGIKSKGWYAENSDQWQDKDNFARIVTELCTTYPNVYGDISYLLELLKSNESSDGIQNHFENNFLTALGTKNFADKVMFGSDWNMPEIIDETDDYLDFYSKTLFSKKEFSAYKEKFFWKNALNYLDIPNYLNRLDAIADRPEIIAYAKALRTKFELLISS
jgi:predicted TIM-barrel fold metal-dependent hydrolase